MGICLSIFREKDLFLTRILHPSWTSLTDGTETQRNPRFFPPIRRWMPSVFGPKASLAGTNLLERIKKGLLLYLKFFFSFFFFFFRNVTYQRRVTSKRIRTISCWESKNTFELLSRLKNFYNRNVSMCMFRFLYLKNFQLNISGTLDLIWYTNNRCVDKLNLF